MTQPTAVVTAFLAWSLLAFPKGYSSGDNTQQGMAAVRWGADYLMKVWSAGVGTDVNIIYQVFAAATHFKELSLHRVTHWSGLAFVCAHLSTELQLCLGRNKHRFYKTSKRLYILSVQVFGASCLYEVSLLKAQLQAHGFCPCCVIW